MKSVFGSLQERVTFQFSAYEFMPLCAIILNHITGLCVYHVIFYVIFKTGFTAYGNACFITGGSGNYLSWSKARDWCKKNLADLAVITNEYDQVRIRYR